jgi:hypothetical protein
MMHWIAPLLNIKVLFLLSLSIGCAQSPKTIGLEEYDQNSQAHGAAYRVDAMHIRKPMPSHADWKPLEFYFKKCTEMGEGSFYSKTSYVCTDP